MDGDHAQPRLDADLRRQRLLDMEHRIARARGVALAILMAALVVCIPWIGWHWLVPAAGAVIIPVWSLTHLSRARRPERLAALAWTAAPMMIACSVAITGGPSSPAVTWWAAPAVTLGARFERRGVVAGLVFMLSLLLVSTIPVDPAAVARRPDTLILSAALMLAVTLFSGAVVQSDREHRIHAVVDPLTGLFNRMALHQHFGDIQQQARVVGQSPPIGFLLMDIDHFKAVNDHHGHQTGDRVLHGVASVLRRQLRAFDQAYRIGGEEFVVVLAGADRDRTVQIAEHLRACVAEAEPAGLPVTISIGVATSPGGPCELDELYRRADSALYAAKNAGRNRVVDAEAMAPSASPAVAAA